MHIFGAIVVRLLWVINGDLARRRKTTSIRRVPLNPGRFFPHISVFKMASPRSPGPYFAAAQDFNSGTLPFEDLVDIGLEPFISARPVPNASIDEQLVELASSGPGGRMMAALVLLATEPGLGSSASKSQSHCF